MAVKMIQKVREKTGLKNYGISKELRARGYEITTQGIDGYEKEGARSMRLDVLSGLGEIVRDFAKLPVQTVFDWVREEFSVEKGRKK